MICWQCVKTGNKSAGNLHWTETKSKQEADDFEWAPEVTEKQAKTDKVHRKTERAEGAPHLLGTGSSWHPTWNECISELKKYIYLEGSWRHKTQNELVHVSLAVPALGERAGTVVLAKAELLWSSSATGMVTMEAESNGGCPPWWVQEVTAPGLELHPMGASRCPISHGRGPGRPTQKNQLQR